MGTEVTFTDLKREIRHLNKVLPKSDVISIKGKKDDIAVLFVEGVDKLTEDEYADLAEETKTLYMALTPEPDDGDDGDDDGQWIMKEIDEIPFDQLKAAVKTLNEVKVTTNINIRGKKKKDVLELFFGALEAVAKDDENKVPEDVWVFNESCFYEENSENPDGSESAPEQMDLPASGDGADTDAPDDAPNDAPEPETKPETNKTVAERAVGILAPAFNKTLEDLISMISNGKLNTHPQFQRKSGIWKKGDKICLIKTILAGYPIPEIYIADVDGETVLVDGQQRTTTIFDWFTGELAGQVKQFANLNKGDTKAIEKYPIVVRDLGEVTQEQIKEIFRNLNATSYALNKIEIFNSEYGQCGGLFDVAEELSNHSLFASIRLFSETQTNRMLDVEYLLTILSTVLSFEGSESYFGGTNALKKWLKEHGEDYPTKTKVIKKFKSVADLIESMDLGQTLWAKKVALFSLICELMSVKTVPKKDALKKKLVAFDKKIAGLTIEDHESNSKKLAPYINFHKNINQATASKPAREQRGLCIREMFGK